MSKRSILGATSCTHAAQAPQWPAPVAANLAALPVRSPRRLGAVRISVIIPALNAAATINVQMEALARQDWRGWWELIVADNGSSDDTSAAVARCARRLGLARWRVVDASGRRGAAYARNAAAAVALGNAFAFVDADDEMDPGWLRAMAVALEHHELVASRLDYARLNSDEMRRMRGGAQERGLQSYAYPAYLPHAAAAGLCARRDLHHCLGGFDEAMLALQDTDYCWRAQLIGARLVFEADALMHYRLRPTVRGTCRQARRWGEYNVRLYRRYRERGMASLSWRRGVREWVRLMRRCPDAFDASKRARWLWKFNWAWGRLYGSIKYRTFAL